MEKQNTGRDIQKRSINRKYRKNKCGYDGKNTKLAFI